MIDLFIKTLYLFARKGTKNIGKRDFIDMRKDRVGKNFVMKDYKEPKTLINKRRQKTK